MNWILQQLADLRWNWEHNIILCIFSIIAFSGLILLFLWGWIRTKKLERMMQERIEKHKKEDYD